MSREIYVENFENGVLTDATSVVLADPLAAYGIKETLSGNIAVASGAATVKESTGLYTYDISALDITLEYTAYFKIIRTTGDTEYVLESIPTASAPVLDSYCTEAECDTYMAGRLNSDSWDDATELNRVKALATATRYIDRLNFLGEKADDEQTLQFPRYADTEVPQDIKDACSEIALSLLDGVDPELEFENLSMVSQGYSNVRSTYDRSIPAEHVLAGIPSVAAWRYLKAYLRDSLSFDISRVS